MRPDHARTGLLIALTLLVGPVRPAESAAITANMRYSTAGQVEATGIEGAPVVRFEGVDSGSLTTGGASFDLGRFVVASTPLDGSTTTYHGTPFDLSFTATAVDGVPLPDAEPVTMKGWLYGTVTGSDASKLRAMMIVNDNLDVEPYPSYLPPFRAGPLRVYLSSAPSSAGEPSGGSAPIRSVIYAVEAVPEPGAIALFALATGTAGLRRIRRR